jgi:hypothetical protein
LEETLRQTSTSFLGVITRALRGSYDGIAKEPLPERWVDLIKHLDEREKTEQAQDQVERSPQPRRQAR